MLQKIRKLSFSNARQTGNRIFWVWVAYQAIKGTLTTSLIWIPLIWVYIFMDWRGAKELQEAAEKAGLVYLNLCVWDKGTGGMGSFYRSQHELVFVFRKGKKSHRNNIQLGSFGRNRTNVWSYPSANTSKEGRKALKDHPTPKPTAMIADIIKDVTTINDAVLDPFLGSGSALLAAEKTGRRCYGIEIDPVYVDVSIRRWQELTGLHAIHAETGIKFSDMEVRHVRQR